MLIRILTYVLSSRTGNVSRYVNREDNIARQLSSPTRMPVGMDSDLLFYTSAHSLISQHGTQGHDSDNALLNMEIHAIVCDSTLTRSLV